MTEDRQPSPGTARRPQLPRVDPPPAPAVNVLKPTDDAHGRVVIGLMIGIVTLLALLTLALFISIP